MNFKLINVCTGWLYIQRCIGWMAWLYSYELAAHVLGKHKLIYGFFDLNIKWSAQV